MRKVLVLAAAVVLGALSQPVAAEEVKASISASMFIQMSAPIESRAAAYDAALRDRGAMPKPAQGFPEGEVLPDGSVRYGRTTVTVRNPCPPSEHVFGPPPLPGRRARN
jgi:hypothetical protein